MMCALLQRKLDAAQLDCWFDMVGAAQGTYRRTRGHQAAGGIRVKLDVPTRHGESELYLLSTVPKSAAEMRPRSPASAGPSSSPFSI